MDLQYSGTIGLRHKANMTLACMLSFFAICMIIADPSVIKFNDGINQIEIQKIVAN